MRARQQQHSNGHAKRKYTQLQSFLPIYRADNRGTVPTASPFCLPLWVGPSSRLNVRAVRVCEVSASLADVGFGLLEASKLVFPTMSHLTTTETRLPESYTPGTCAYCSAEIEFLPSVVPVDKLKLECGACGRRSLVKTAGEYSQKDSFMLLAKESPGCRPLRTLPPALTLTSKILRATLLGSAAKHLLEDAMKEVGLPVLEGKKL